MKGDFTRLTFDASKHYTSVLMQQGRLQLDADWNELVEIQNYLRQTQAHNMIGASGVAKLDKDNQSFKVTPQGTNLIIAPGRIYVNGILCELEKELLYTNQPDHPNALESDLGEVGLKEDTCYIAYLDVWERHITAIDDLNIREKALVSIPDTSTRTKVIWQVKLLEVGAKDTPKDVIDNAWKQFIENRSFERKGLLQASLASKIQTQTGTETDKDELENRLYRVEIHQGGTLGEAQFKWSRDNGSIVSPVKTIESKTKTITIRVFGQDDRRSFEPGQWIEILGEVQELNQQPGKFVRLNAQTQGNKLVYDDVIPEAIANQKKLKVRRWDQNPFNSDSAILPTSSGKHLLENGIQVEFTSPNNSTAFLNTGDYWLIPARSVDNDIEWPTDESEQRRSLPPRGIRHYYTRLALLFFQNNEEGFASTADQDKYKDYRQAFPLLINCFDKTTDDTISGKLTIQGGLFVTGKEENGQYVPAKVGIGTTEPTAYIEIDGKNNNEQEAALLQINISDREKIGQVIKAAPQQQTNLQEWQNSSGQVLAHIDSTGVYHNGSSRDLKDNISELSSQDVNRLLSQLNPVKFTYKADQAHKIHLGFISEEAPDWITSADKKSISLIDVVGALTKVVKDHRRTITVLADFIDNQQREIEILKSELIALKAQIRHH